MAKAASSVKSSELQLNENVGYSYFSESLFGPVQYGYNFSILKNGIPSGSDSINIVVDGNGNVTQFSKSAQGLEYPSAQPKITLEQAQKQFAEQFDVGLFYIPIYKNGKPNNWILGWRPIDQSLYPIDALTGKRIDYEGKESVSTSVVYSEVAKSKDVFQARSSSTELSAKEAAQLVEKVAYIPADRKLISQTLRNDYQIQIEKSGSYTGAVMEMIVTLVLAFQSNPLPRSMQRPVKYCSTRFKLMVLFRIRRRKSRHLLEVRSLVRLKRR